MNCLPLYSGRDLIALVSVVTNNTTEIDLAHWVMECVYVDLEQCINMCDLSIEDGQSDSLVIEINVNND